MKDTLVLGLLIIYEKINHIGVAVYSLDDSVEIFKKILNITLQKKKLLKVKGRNNLFNLGESKIELISSSRKKTQKYLSKKSEVFIIFVSKLITLRVK